MQVEVGNWCLFKAASILAKQTMTPSSHQVHSYADDARMGVSSALGIFQCENIPDDDAYSDNILIASSTKRVLQEVLPRLGKVVFMLKKVPLHRFSGSGGVLRQPL